MSGQGREGGTEGLLFAGDAPTRGLLLLRGLHGASLSILKANIFQKGKPRFREDHCLPKATGGEQPACLPVQGPLGGTPGLQLLVPGRVRSWAGVVGLGASESRRSLGLTWPGVAGRFWQILRVYPAQVPFGLGAAPIAESGDSCTQGGRNLAGPEPVTASQRTRNLLRAGEGRRLERTGTGEGEWPCSWRGRAHEGADLQGRRGGGGGGPRVLGRTAGEQGRAGAARGGDGRSGHALGSEHAGRAGSSPQSKVHSWSWAGQASVPCSPCFPALPGPPQSTEVPRALHAEAGPDRRPPTSCPWWAARLRGAALSQGPGCTGAPQRPLSAAATRVSGCFQPPPRPCSTCTGPAQAPPLTAPRAPRPHPTCEPLHEDPTAGASPSLPKPSRQPSSERSPPWMSPPGEGPGLVSPPPETTPGEGEESLLAQLIGLTSWRPPTPPSRSSCASPPPGTLFLPWSSLDLCERPPAGPQSSSWPLASRSSPCPCGPIQSHTHTRVPTPRPGLCLPDFSPWWSCL